MSVSLADIEAAAARLKGMAVETPLLESAALNERLGGRVLIKPETLQRAGAFKFRGAYNKISQLTGDERARGVVACSSGNHAQGVALAAQILGAPAVIVMPADAPTMKVANTRGYGAEVVHYDRYTEDREAITSAIAIERGMTIVWPFDDADIAAGQGTVGLEMVRQADCPLDYVLAPISGGGLLAGIATAVKAMSPNTVVIGVEPEDFDDTRRSLQAGEHRRNATAGGSICDALQAPTPGKVTLPIMLKTVSEVLLVSDAEAADAMRYAFATLKLVVEPGGVVALAALLSGKLDLSGKTAGIVLSGGNVDPELFARVLAGEI
ncbi:MAG TPA: threonine/serine dehydratase [Caulobacteraceae bacterium]|nr:threonine/serine dehydratase [Caulobacteraceae bacterium]